jgi:hypothetical protein
MPRVSVAAASLDGFEPVSPELVLVLPPEERTRALAVLPPPPRWVWRPAPAVETARERLAFAAFCGACAVMTLGPLALIVFAH